MKSTEEILDRIENMLQALKITTSEKTFERDDAKWELLLELRDWINR